MVDGSGLDRKVMVGFNVAKDAQADQTFSYRMGDINICYESWTNENDTNDHMPIFRNCIQR